jgi:hypothetical protein
MLRWTSLFVLVVRVRILLTVVHLSNALWGLLVLVLSGSRSMFRITREVAFRLCLDLGGGCLYRAVVSGIEYVFFV